MTERSPRQGRIISSSDPCGECSSPVVHEQSENKEECADYFVYCTNAACKNTTGIHCGDQECPDWAHGRSNDAIDGDE